MLAIGIVVDDAIVVLENIERWLDKGLPVREATIKAMNEITGPILAITLVLSSVLLPSAFLGGITGQFFRQFALTISVSMIISAINAMTMTPARAAWIFASRKPGAARRPGQGGAAVVELRPVRRAGDRVAAGADAGRLAGPASGGDGTARRRPAACRATLLTWGIYARPLPARRGRRRGARLVHHPAGELGPGQVLPRLQLGLRPGDPGLRQDRGLVPPPQRRSCCWSTSA